MGALGIGQIYNAARTAGFTPTQAVIATAIALAESSGDPTARCDNCVPGVTEDSRGLWQINVDAHPQYASWNLNDPVTNARAAYAVSGGGSNFSPWSTYGTGPGHTNAYLSHLPDVYAAIGASGGGAPPDSVPGATVPTITGGAGSTSQAGLNLNPLDGFGLFSSIGSSVGKDVARVTITAAFVIGGITLAVLGFYKGVQPTVQKVQTQAAQGAAAAAKVAAV